LRNGRYRQTFGVKRQARAAHRPAYWPHAARLCSKRETSHCPAGREARSGSVPTIPRRPRRPISLPAAAIRREVGRHFQPTRMGALAVGSRPRLRRFSPDRSEGERSEGEPSLRLLRFKIAPGDFDTAVNGSRQQTFGLRRQARAARHSSYGLAPLTATFEGGELRALFRRREDARGHPHFRRALAARSFHRRKLEGAGGTSPFVRTGVVMP
jgi:hypothetical protein